MRVSLQDIESRINYLNKITNSPVNYSDPTQSGFKSKIGHYRVDKAYGGHALYRVDNEAGGVEDISRIGHSSRKDLYNGINAYIAGIQSNQVDKEVT